MSSQLSAIFSIVNDKNAPKYARITNHLDLTRI